MPKIIGLDLALTGGIGVCADDHAAATIKVPRIQGGIQPQQLDTIEQSVMAWCRDADLVVIEDYVTGVYASSVTGMVHGVVRLALWRAGVPFTVVSPAGLKKFATGAGNVKKTQMAVAAVKRAGAEFRDDNQCDAFWLRCAGLWATGRLFFDLPKAHTETLNKVIWPEVIRGSATTVAATV